MIIKSIYRKIIPKSLRQFLWNKKEMLIKFCVLINKKNTFYIRQSGYCPVCMQNTVFSSKTFWLRECFKCLNCGSNPRQRAVMVIIEKYCPNWRNLSIHESSPNECAITKTLNQCKNYIGTQYYSKYKPGEIVNNYRNENLEEQSFPNEIFDIVITQDVVEHIYHPQKAFLEIARTLKKGGVHIFTVPIANKFIDKTEIWAKPDEKGEPVFLKTEEWHGNPIDEKGSPVTMHYGYDIVDIIRDCSGMETVLETLYDLNQGIAGGGEYIEVFVSKKYNS